MAFTDELVGAAIGVAEDKLDVEKESGKTTFGGAVLRFFVSLVWVIVSCGFALLGAAAMVIGDIGRVFGSSDFGSFYVLGIGLCIVIALVTFIVPYLRKKGTVTRRCGILAIGDALWWIYLMISM